MATTTKKPVAKKPVAKKPVAKKPTTRATKNADDKTFTSFVLTGDRAHMFRSCIEQAMSCVADADGGRPILEGVAIDINPREIVMTSADGFRLINVTIAAGETPFNGVMTRRVLNRWTIKQFIVSFDAMKKNLGRMRADDIEVRFDVGSITVADKTSPKTGAMSLACEYVAGTYPNYEQLIPVEDPKITPHWKFAVNADYLADACRLVKKHHETAIMRVFPGATPSQPIVCKWGTLDWSVQMVIMPMFVTW